jgi:hypothetical protein
MRPIRLSTMETDEAAQAIVFRGHRYNCAALAGLNWGDVLLKQGMTPERAARCNCGVQDACAHIVDESNRMRRVLRACPRGVG